MGMTFEALTGVLGIDSTGWDRGFSNAYGTLGKFNQAVSRDLARAAATANTSIVEMAERAEQLSEALGTSLGSAATMLADAMESPVKGIEALRTAGLKFSESQREEIRTLTLAGQAFDAHDAILNRISESYSRLQSNIDDLNASADTESEAAKIRVESLEDELRLKNDIARFDEEIRLANLQYEAKLLDDLNAKWVEQDALKRKSEEYRNVGVTENRPRSEMTNSELAGDSAGVDVGDLLQMVPGGGTFARFIKNPGLIAAAAMTGGIAGTVKEYATAESEQTRLRSVFKATGGNVDELAKSYGKMADELKRVTTFTGSAITESQIYLTTLKLGEGTTRDALRASADLAAVMGTSLPDASRTLGRALADPENAAGALRRAGILLSEKQQEQIKSFMALNDVAAAQKLILDELSSRTGGAAAAAADTLIGRLVRLKNASSDWAETIGHAIVHPLQTLGGVLDGLMNQVAKIFAKARGDEQAAAGLEENDKPTGVGVDRDRRRREYLAKKDAEQRRKFGFGLTKAQIQRELDKVKSDRLEDYDKETDAGKNFNFEGEQNQAALLAAARAGNIDARNAVSGETLSRLEEEGRRSRNRTSLAELERLRKEQESTPEAKLARATEFANSEQGQDALRDLSSELGKAFMDGLKEDVKSLGGVLKETGTTVGANGLVNESTITEESAKAIDDTIARYRVMFEQMPQFNSQAWEKVENELKSHLKNAATAAEEQKAFYLKNAEEVAAGATKIFEAYDKAQTDDAKKRAEKAKQAVAAIDRSALPGDLGKASYGQAHSVAAGLGRDVLQTLKPDESGVIDNSQIQTILDNYKAVLSQMPGYSEQVFSEIEKQVVDHAKNAMESTGALREVYMQRLKETLANSEGPTGVIQKKNERIGTTAAQDQAAYYAALQGASKNDLQAAVRQRMSNVDQTRAIGIGTPEQKRGLVELAKLQAETMRQIRNSTGETREANIAELKKLDEAWAKAYAAIRAGSKETVEQLVKDAKKQGEAGADAAKKTGAEARRERIKARQDADAAQGGLANSMNAIAQQGAAMSAGLMSAFSPFMGFIGGFQSILNQTTDPMEKLNLQIDNLSATWQGMAINAGTFGENIALNTESTRKSLHELLTTKQRLLMIQEQERKEAERMAVEAFRRERAQRANTADELNDPNGRNAIIGTAGGAPINITFNGVHDAKQMADIIVGEVNRRGYDRGPRRQPFNRR